MERLTEHELYNGKVVLKKCKNKECPDKCAYCDVPKEAMLRLKELEDVIESNNIISREAVISIIDKLGYINVKNHDDYNANCRVDKVRQAIIELPDFCSKKENERS